MAESARPSTDSFRAFVTRHDHLFTLFGALLVVSAFYTQDVKLPPLAKKSGDIHAAIVERDDMSYLNTRLGTVSVQLRDDLASANSKSIFLDEYRKILGITHDFDAAQDDLSLSRLIVDRLPSKPPALKAQGEALNERIAALSQQETDVLSYLDMADLPGVQGHPDTDSIPGYKKLMDAAFPFTIASGAFERDVRQFQAQVSQEADNQAKSFETQSARWERIAEALVILGFVAGLLSKLLKLPALGGDPG
jgi:hypothetical protein